LYTDLKKAFDTVYQYILISKLKKIGISDPFLSWLQSYLTDRVQMVKINSSISNIVSISSGVPQGGHLSPLLFLIFINDVGKVFKYCKFSLFADDFKMYLPLSSISDAKNLQSDLEQLVVWCVENGFSINISKCVHISFHRHSSAINF
jgi:hypothetical protein